MKTWNTKSGYKVVQLLKGRSNVFLLTDGKRTLLVDTGPAMMWNILNNRLVKLNIHSLDYLVLTHSHFDHAANAKRIRLLFGAKVFVHRSEADCLENGINPKTSGTNILYRFLVTLMNKSISGFLSYDPCDYDYLVDDRLSLTEYGFNAYILHTPGHTAGSVSVIVDDEIALSGDSMFGIFRKSVFPPVALDQAEMVKSWGKLLDTGCKLFLPSHGSANTRELVEREYMKRKNR